MDHAYRDKLFRMRMQGHSERSRLSGALLLGMLGLFWLSLLSAMVLLFAGGIAGLSRWSVFAVAAAVPASFVLGRRHARKLGRSL